MCTSSHETSERALTSSIQSFPRLYGFGRVSPLFNPKLTSVS